MTQRSCDYLPARHWTVIRRGRSAENHIKVPLRVQSVVPLGICAHQRLVKFYRNELLLAGDWPGESIVRMRYSQCTSSYRESSISSSGSFDLLQQDALLLCRRLSFRGLPSRRASRPTFANFKEWNSRGYHTSGPSLPGSGKKNKLISFIELE
jgi:hypothetical protein